MKKLLISLGVMLATVVAFASFEATNDTTKLGFFNQIWCSTGVTCSKVGGRLKIVTNAAVVGDISMDSGESIINSVDDTIEVNSNDEHMTFRVEGFEAKDAILSLAADQGDDTADVFSFTSGDTNGLTIKNGSTSLATLSTVGDWVFLGTTPTLTIGDAGAEDAQLLWDGNAQDFSLGLDDSADKLVVSLGTTLGNTNRMAFNSADLNIVLGDASAADVGFIWDGNAQDFNISLDDSVDKLVIGLGAVAGTTNRMAFNSADLNIVLGDASAADMSLVFDGNAQDFQIGIDDSTDDLVLGLGSAPGTTDALRIDENQVVTFLQDPVFAGATPYLVLGDAGAEDAGLLFDGNAQDFNISLDDSTDDLVIGLGSAAGTTDALRIDENQVVTFLQDPVFAGTTPTLVVGDGGAEDEQITFNDATNDYSIGVDNSAGKLVISKGSALGTTNMMAFNSTGFNIVLHDASAADMSLVWDGNAQDFNIGLDDSTDDLVIGLGSAPGTTDAIRVDEAQDVTIVQGLLGLGTDELVGFLQNQVVSTTTSLTAAQCGSTIYNNSADVLTLPEASTVPGCRYTFITDNASNFDINPADATDQISLLTNAAGDAIRNATVGNSIVLEAVGANSWHQVSIIGTWSDVN